MLYLASVIKREILILEYFEILDDFKHKNHNIDFSKINEGSYYLLRKKGVANKQIK